MSEFKFNLEPKNVPLVSTEHRSIKTQIPVPASIPLLKKIKSLESENAIEQLPVIWDKASGYKIYDEWGNYWIDFTSAIFVTNSGHANKQVLKRIQEYLDKPLLHSYYYPTRIRAAFLEKLMQMTENPAKIKELYPTLEKISIDYAIMEKVDTNQVRIIKADLDWSDVGTWEAIFNELAKSPTDNITRGPVELIDCEGCIVYADNNKKIALIGKKDMVVIDTAEGELICKKGESKRIKEIVQ